jgi:hypothetical protein
MNKDKIYNALSLFIVLIAVAIAAVATFGNLTITESLLAFILGVMFLNLSFKFGEQR